MSGRSRSVLRIVSAEPTDDGAAERTIDPLDALVAAVDRTGPRHGSRSASSVGGSDLAALREEIDADVARLAGCAGSTSSDLSARWDAVRRLCDPADLEHLAGHATSLHEATDSVRRQHTETAEDLGPLWDTWAGPAAEAVQDRVSALARSAHALVVELETTAGRLTDAHDRVVDAVATLADDLAGHVADPAPGPVAHDPAGVCDRAATACARAWDDARGVLAGGVGGAADVSRFGPRSP